MIETLVTIEEGQMCRIGDECWSIARLITLTKGLDVMDVPLSHLNINNSYNDLTLKQMARHIKAVEDADLSFPIIMDENGEIMDGRHRIMKCLVNDIPSIKAVRFDKNPSPCSIDD